MPTKRDTLTFIKENNVNIKAPTSLSVNQLLDAVERFMNKKDTPKALSNKWKRLKLLKDMSPEEKEAQRKRLLKRQLKAGTLGKPAEVPKLKRDKKVRKMPEGLKKGLEKKKRFEM